MYNSSFVLICMLKSEAIFIYTSFVMQINQSHKFLPHNFLLHRNIYYDMLQGAIHEMLE